MPPTFTYQCEKCEKFVYLHYALKSDAEGYYHFPHSRKNGTEKNCQGRLIRIYSPPYIIVR